MKNIINYVQENVNTFKEEPLNEIDNLVFAILSYINYDGINFKYKKTIEYVADEFNIINASKTPNPYDFTEVNSIELLNACAISNRYKNIVLTDYVNNYSQELTLQYASITFHIPGNKIYVAFRGTDDTLTGWKEDFKMCVTEVVPSQTEALKYLRKIMLKYPFKKVYTGGHSKGGNLAVYSATYINRFAQLRFKQIYDNDGPGFKESLLELPNYKRIQDKITSLIPQTSIIGMLLNHEEDYSVIKSNQKGILQHDGFSWEVSNHQFKHLHDVTDDCKIIDTAITNMLSTLTDEQREKFIDTIFDIVEKNEFKTLSDLRKTKIDGIIKLGGTYNKLDIETKKLIKMVLKQLFDKTIQSIREVNKSSDWKSIFPFIK